MSLIVTDITDNKDIHNIEYVIRVIDGSVFLSCRPVYAFAGTTVFGLVRQKLRRFKNLASSTKPSMIGTSQNRPMVVPNAASDPTPYMDTAAAMAISK